MPRTLTWGKSIDVVEISPTTSNALGRRRIWEIRSKAGGGYIGMVNWDGSRREYVFWPVDHHTLLTGLNLLDVGKFCQNQTEAMVHEKRKAAG